MTSYDGKALSFVPGREVVNKEPPVSKYVVEKLYRVHRERLLNCQPTIDSRMHIPDFLKNTSWKLNAKLLKDNQIKQVNEDIYRRIAKVENGESLYTKATREHIRRVKHKTTYLNHLKQVGRVHNILKVQRENEHMAFRLERARPEYSLKKCQDWYQHHLNFKEGRRSDPTGGHIMHGMTDILPKPLPPMRGTESNFNSILSSMDNSISNRNMSVSQPLPGSNRSGFKHPPTPLPSLIISNSEGLLTSPFKSNSKILVNPDTFNYKSSSKGGGGKKGGNSKGRAEEYSDDEEEDDGSDDVSRSGNSVGSKSSDTSASLVGDNYILLSSRHVAIANESKNVNLHIVVCKSYDESVGLRVTTTTLPPKLLVERNLTIDQAYDLISRENTSHIAKAVGQDDLQAIRTLLTNMFVEADADKSGYLTFDEFQVLMEKVEIGISSEELRFVISEADENENGVVDYAEFIPLAVDMIQSFRARNKAKRAVNTEDTLIDSQIMGCLSKDEINSLSKDCLLALKELDPQGLGLRQNDVRKALSRNPSITPTEVNLICQMLPRDKTGRLLSGTFADVLLQVRFLTMKNAYVESRGSDLQKYVLELCKVEEKKVNKLNGKSGDNLSGLLPFRTLITLLCNAPRLSLSRLQVMVIMSEANVSDGMINYFQFIPTVSKTIEIMFEPKALRQRAELIEVTDLSPEALLKDGMSSEEFEKKLHTLFQSYDVDKNQTLDENEFIACLESLDLQLTRGEMGALMATADVNNSGTLHFEDFLNFFTNNLIHLEREKHIRCLSKSLHDKSHNPASESRDFHDHVRQIFEIADANKSGSLDYNELLGIMNSLELNITPYELEVLMSESNMTIDGQVDYLAFLPIMVDILKAFKGKERALEAAATREKWAALRASKLVQGLQQDIVRMAKYIRDRLRIVMETIEDPVARVSATKELLCHPNSDLARTEINSMMAALFISDTGRSSVSHMHLRPDLSVNALVGILTQIRMKSIMRNLLEDVKPTSVKKQIEILLSEEVKRLVEQKKLEEGSIYLPVKDAYRVLVESQHLRLSRAEVISLMSLSSCHDSTGTFINVELFASSAATLIAEMKDVDFIEHKTALLEQGVGGDSNMLSEVSVKEVTDYFNHEMAALDPHNTGFLPDDLAASVIVKLPSFNLTEADAHALLSPYHDDSMEALFDPPRIHWKEFAANSAHSIKAVLKETFLRRRINLYAISDSHKKNDSKGSKKERSKLAEDALNTMKTLAEKLIDLAKVRKVGEIFSINLPDDVATRVRPSSGHQTVEKEGGRSIKLLKQGVLIPMVDAKFFNGVKLNMAHHVLSSKKNQLQKYSALVRVNAIEIDASQEKMLEAKICNSNNTDEVSIISLPLRLPSIALADKDVAEEFCKNLTERIYCEYTDASNYSTYKFKVVSDSN